MQDAVHRIWYGKSRLVWLLLPLEAVFRLISAVRRLLYRNGLFKQTDPGVPVVVVGNITAGGTGKTPVTLWLVERLRAEGFSPGIVSRGYGGQGGGLLVEQDSSADIVGDEPLLLARRSACPVMVDSDRGNAACRLAELGVDVVIADDGLQHYALKRDYEICVIDAERGFGNGHQLPAGPLREATARLSSVDQVLLNGSVLNDDLDLPRGHISFRLELQQAVRVNGNGRRDLQTFSGPPVNAAAGIGHPERFFNALEGEGLDVVQHPFPDHSPIAIENFDTQRPLLLTEKDAVKLPANTPDHVWFVPVQLQMDESVAVDWISRLVTRLKGDKK